MEQKPNLDTKDPEVQKFIANWKRHKLQHREKKAIVRDVRGYRERRRVLVAKDNAEKGISEVLACASLAEGVEKRREEDLKRLQTDVLRKLESELTGEDDIHRKKLIGATADKNYKKDVTEKIEAVLTPLKASCSDPKEINGSHVAPLKQLKTELAEQQKHYGNMTKFLGKEKKKEKEIEQRLRKVKAIGEHITELDAIVATLTKADAVRMEEREKIVGESVLLLKTSKDDPEELKKAARAANQFLRKADKEAKKAFFAKASDDDVADIVFNLNSADLDGAVKSILDGCGDNTSRMDSVTNTILLRELAKSNSKGTFLRSNSAASQIISKYNATTPSGKKFIEDSLDGAMRRLSSVDHSMEIDPVKMKPEDGNIRNRNIGEHKAMVRAAIDDISAMKVPDEIGKVTATIYEGYLKKFPGDTDGAMVMVGGHIMLRLICPSMATGPAFAKAKPEQKRAIILQMKLMQNIANQITFTAKEQYMTEMNDLIVSGAGPSPEAVKLQTFFKDAVERGQTAKLPTPKLEEVLGSPPVKVIFKQFLVSIFADENLDFYDIAKTNPKGASAQNVYDDYLSDDARINQVNLDETYFTPFHEANKTKKWDTAPWAKAAEYVYGLMKNDCIQKLVSAKSDHLHKIKLILGRASGAITL